MTEKYNGALSFALTEATVFGNADEADTTVTATVHASDSKTIAEHTTAEAQPEQPKQVDTLTLSTTDIYSKEVSYSINSNRKEKLEKMIVGKFTPVDDTEFDENMFEEVTCSSKGLEELKVSLHIKKSTEKSSLVRMLFSKLRGM